MNEYNYGRISVMKLKILLLRISNENTMHNILLKYASRIHASEEKMPSKIRIASKNRSAIIITCISFVTMTLVAVHKEETKSSMVGRWWSDLVTVY